MHVCVCVRAYVRALIHIVISEMRSTYLECLYGTECPNKLLNWTGDGNNWSQNSLWDPVISTRVLVKCYLTLRHRYIQCAITWEKVKSYVCLKGCLINLQQYDINTVFWSDCESDINKSTG